MSIIQGNSKTSAAGYTIDQSIRFNDDDSAYLTRTPSSAGNRRTFTLSTWVKFSEFKPDNYIFSSWISSGATAYAAIYMHNDFRVRFEHQGGTRIKPSMLFRDPAAWYHIVLRVDTTDSTANDRYQMYVNGERQTDLLENTQPALNFETYINTTQPHYFGRNGYSAAMAYSDLYHAETHFIDGTALDASSFGKVNSDTGQWVPIAYTGSYGTNGFYITGENSAALGTDYSGNGNNFTSSGLTSADQMLDTPTNNFCTLSPIDKNSNVTLSNGNLRAANTSSGSWQDVRGTLFATSGKWYYEWTPVSATYAAAGWSTDFSTDHTEEESKEDTSYYRGVSTAGRGLVIGSASPDTSVANFSVGDTIMMAIDIDTGDIWVGVNGTWEDGQDPGSGGTATGTWSSRAGYPITPWVECINIGPTTSECNFGQSGGFTYGPPTGFNAWSTANLPDPTIADPTKHFNTVLWTGDGTSSRTISGVGFNPDLVWAKSRSAATTHKIMDDVRGANLQLSSDQNAAEINVTTDTSGGGLGTTTADGFTLVSGTSNANNVNASGTTFVAWNWKANGSGTSNTDGSIASTVSANTTSGSSIVTYSGTGATATVGHGLGVAPKFMIIKRRDTTGGWIVYHETIGATKYLYLNTTDTPFTSSTPFNNTAPTSSVFTLGTANETNNSSGTYVAYCFAEVEGFSKFGKYTGNGSADGPFIYTGFRPAFILYKNTTTAGTNWDMLDSTREPYNTVGQQLIANGAAAEAAEDHRWDFLSNGFKARDGSGSNNGSGATIVYAAFAESPFKTANAR